MLRPRIAGSVLGTLLVLSSVPLPAQNLLSNGELDSGIAGWGRFGFGPEPEWVEGIDHDDCEDSGSGAFSSNTLDVLNAAGMCVTGLQAGESYSLRGDFRFVAGAQDLDSVRLNIDWLDSSGHCSGNQTGQTWTDELFLTDTTTWHPSRNLQLVAPATTASARVSVHLFASNGGFAQVRFDRVHFFRGHGLMFLDDFEAQSTCRWSP